VDVRAITLDLDDTLWPYAPVAVRIAQELGAFLAAVAPGTAARYDEHALVRALTAPRQSRLVSPVYARWMEADGLRQELSAADEEPSLAEEAITVTDDARQRVVLFPDAEPALARLSARYRIVAVTDGASDIARIGIGRWFDGVVTSRAIGVPKPDPRIFLAACEFLDLPPSDVLHAGDDIDKDVDGALKAGLQAAWVHRGADDGANPRAGALSVPDLMALAIALDA
jgi:FMN hydrolase / 5-amino-6-(5-phospho-D-ribitylamino)uracil phosphatase